MSTSDGSFSAQNWQVGTLNGAGPPLPVILGSTAGDTITGGDHVVTDIAGGLGADTLLGGAGGTEFVYEVPGEVQSGEVIDGGVGNSAIADIDVGFGVSFDFTGATISNVGGLVFENDGTTATFTSSQIQSIGTVVDDNNGLGSNQTLIIRATAVDLSAVTFQSWSATNQVLIEGTAGSDHLVGGDVRDVIDGGPGKDTLIGGPRVDTFVFDSRLNRLTNVDHITNFVHGQDKIALSHHIFGAHLLVSANTFYAAPHANAAVDTADRIIYNKTTGGLFFDSDGRGGAAPSSSPFSVRIRQVSASMISSWSPKSLIGSMESAGKRRVNPRLPPTLGGARLASMGERKPARFSI